MRHTFSQRDGKDLTSHKDWSIATRDILLARETAIVLLSDYLGARVNRQPGRRPFILYSLLQNIQNSAEQCNKQRKAIATLRSSSERSDRSDQDARLKQASSDSPRCLPGVPYFVLLFFFFFVVPHMGWLGLFGRSSCAPPRASTIVVFLRRITGSYRHYDSLEILKC